MLFMSKRQDYKNLAQILLLVSLLIKSIQTNLDKQINDIIDKLVRPNYYTPTIVNSIDKETMQQYL